jgi:hypothetical protein
MYERVISYPLPGKLGNLLKIETMSKADNVHPSLLEETTLESQMKLLKFELWINYQIRMNKSASLEEVISKELKLYGHEIGIKENLRVTTCLVACLLHFRA